MHQSRFDNPPEAPNALLTAAGAARLLRVKTATLYSYVSRGWIRAVPGPKHRERRYLRADVERVRTRADARLGHAAVAAGALRFGEPVLDSSITEITPGGPVYRGRPAVALALARATPFEAAAELLWTGVLPGVLAPFPPLDRRATDALATFGKLLGRGAAVSVRVAWLRVCAPAPVFGLPEEEHQRARQLIRWMTALLAVVGGRKIAPVLAAASVSEGLAVALGIPPTARARQALDAALILCADHELNVSAFAARVAASAGADLYACVGAALAAFSGPRHGGESARVEALLKEMDAARSARRTLLDRAERGEAIPGFGHRLYPEGDPRGAALLQIARGLGGRRSGGKVQALVDAAKGLGLEPPTLDIGLVAVSEGLRLPRGSAAVIFCLGRTAGWVAHLLEQRGLPDLLRPRARFVPAPGRIS